MVVLIKEKRHFRNRLLGNRCFESEIINYKSWGALELRMSEWMNEFKEDNHESQIKNEDHFCHHPHDL